MSKLSTYRVTIREKQIWTIELLATSRNAAENAAWMLFRDPQARSEFDEDEDTTIQVEEVQS